MIPPHPVDFGRGQLYFGSSDANLSFTQIVVPPNAKSMSLIIVGSGGNGGAGASGAAGTSRGGGGGGGAGASCQMNVPTFFLPPVLYLGLAGRGSQLASGIALHEMTTLSGSVNPVICVVSPGRNGSNGTTTAAGAGGPASSFNNGVVTSFFSKNGQNGAAGLAGSYGNVQPSTQLNAGPYTGSAPGGGGVLDTNQVGGAPYHAGYVKFVPALIQQASVSAGTPDGSNGWRITNPFPIFTCGGGGASNNTGQGGNGGNGGPGCGGGGGGAGVTGGAGGIGGEAWAWIMFQ